MNNFQTIKTLKEIQGQMRTVISDLNTNKDDKSVGDAARVISCLEFLITDLVAKEVRGMDALQRDNFNRALRGQLIGE